MKRLVYIVFLLALLSCEKDGRPVRESRFMEFAVATPDVVTKAEVSMTQLTQATNNLYLYAAKSDGATSTPLVTAPGAFLRYDSDRKVWDAKSLKYEYSGGSYIQQEQNLEWEDDRYYTFYGYCYSTDAVVGSTLVIPSGTFGRQFTVTQPADGDGSTTIDYLLSSIYHVTPSFNYPLVPIELEHAMARIDVDVQIADAMFDQDNEPLIQDITLSIAGIKRKATMLCQQPKSYGEDGTNIWYITFEEASTASYTAQILNSTVNLEGSDTNLDMSFIAVPVRNAEMADYVLTLEYNNVSKTRSATPKDYTYTFNLKDFSPSGWVNGHKVNYVLTIDNSIHLKGTVVDYQDVDYIESVLVPDIPGTK